MRSRWQWPFTTKSSSSYTQRYDWRQEYVINWVSIVRVGPELTKSQLEAADHIMVKSWRPEEKQCWLPALSDASHPTLSIDRPWQCHLAKMADPVKAWILTHFIPKSKIYKAYKETEQMIYCYRCYGNKTSQHTDCCNCLQIFSNLFLTEANIHL